MSTIYGVVEGNTVVLPEDADLPDGSTVEVRLLSPETRRSDSIEAEEQFKRQLVEMGILEKVRTPVPISPEVDRTPLQVSGKPISEMIIEERR